MLLFPTSQWQAVAGEKTERRQAYPFPHVKPDRSGRVKMETLQYFDSHPGGRSATEMLRDPVLGAKVAGDGGDRALRMRLLRYSRDNLLRRRRKGGEYWYEITPSGEKRLIYLWEKNGQLSPDNATSLAAIDEMELKLARAKSILAAREEELSRRVGLDEIKNADSPG